MGRGWAEEKQIGEELQREGPPTGRWRPGRERVERQRATGGQSEKRSRLRKEELERRKHLGKEEVLKAEGRKRGKMGVRWRRGTGRQRQEDPRSRQIKEASTASVRRGWGLREEGLQPGGERSRFQHPSRL